MMCILKLKGQMIKPIPKKLRDEMAQDPYYQRCCVTGSQAGPGVKIEWHHNFESYAHGNKGRVNEKWCILPVLESIHRRADTREVRQYLDWVMLNRADKETLERWSVAGDLVAKRNRLNKAYRLGEITIPTYENQKGIAVL
jgi:hypothetical protein